MFKKTKKLAGKEGRHDPPIYQVRKLKLREGKPIAENLCVRQRNGGVWGGVPSSMQCEWVKWDEGPHERRFAGVESHPGMLSGGDE